MNQSTNKPQGEGKVWVWFLFNEKLTKLRALDVANAGREAQNAVEKKAIQCVIQITEEQGWNLKDKFKGNTLAAYYKELGKLTPHGWRTAVGIVWPDYESKVGKKPVS